MSSRQHDARITPASRWLYVRGHNPRQERVNSLFASFSIYSLPHCCAEPSLERLTAYVEGVRLTDSAPQGTRNVQQCFAAPSTHDHPAPAQQLHPAPRPLRASRSDLRSGTTARLVPTDSRLAVKELSQRGFRCYAQKNQGRSFPHPWPAHGECVPPQGQEKPDADH